MTLGAYSIVEDVLSNDEIIGLINGDLVLAAIAGAAILIGISVQTNSIFIGATGVLQILCAYPWTIFFCTLAVL